MNQTVAAERDRLARELAAVEALACESGRAAEMHRRAAQLLMSAELPDALDRAIEHLRQAAAERPAQPEDLWNLERCLERAGRDRELIALYLESSRRTNDPSQQSHWLHAAVRRLEASGSAGGGDELRLVLEQRGLAQWLARHQPNSARSLSSRLERIGRSDISVIMLEALVVERHDVQSFEDALQLGRLYEQIEEPALAHEAYRRALSMRPAEAGALDAARRYLVAEKRFEQLAELLAVSAAAAPRPAERVRLWRELGRLAEVDLSDLTRAAEAYGRAWEIGGADDDRAELERLHGETGRWDRAAHALRQAITRTVDPSRKVDLLRRLASIQRDRLQQPAQALESLGSAMQLDPTDLSLREQRIELLDRCGDTSALIRALRAYAERCLDPARRDATRRRCFELMLQQGQAPDLNLLRLLSPADPQNRAFLERLSRTTEGRPGDELRRHLLTLIWSWEVASLEEEAALERGLALAEEARSRGEDGAADALLGVLAARWPARLVAVAKDPSGARAPRDRLAEARPRTARETVRSFVRRARAHSSHDLDDSRRDAAEWLRRAVSICPEEGPELDLLRSALVDAGLHDEHLELLERCLRTASGRKEAAVLWEIANVCEAHLGQAMRAAEVLEQMMVAGHLDRFGVERLERLCSELGDNARQARLLEHQSKVARGAERVATLERLARIYERELQANDKALSCYQRLLVEQPDHDVALAKVTERERRLGNARALAELLGHAARATGDPQRREALYRQIVELTDEGLADDRWVAEAWRGLVALDHGDSARRMALKERLRRAKQWADLADLLRIEVAWADHPGEKVAAYLELAELSATRFDDRATSVLYLRQAQSLEPDNTEVLQRLESTYERLGRWRELVSALQRHEAVEPELARKIQLLHKAASVLLQHLGRDEEALAVCRHARELMPRDAESARLMSEIYARRGQWQQLAVLLRDRIASEANEQQRSRLHAELATLLLEQLDDPLSAAAQLELAMRCDPASMDVIPQLRRLYAAQGRWDLLIGVLRAVAGRPSASLQDRAGALCEVGRICEEQLDDLAQAKEAYAEAVRILPAHRPALTALRALSIAQGSWRDAVSLTRKALEVTDDRKQKARLLVESAAILREHLSRPEAAVDALESAIQLDPDNIEAGQLLATTYFQRQDWARASVLMERAVESGVELKEPHEYHYRLAYCSEMLGQEDKAFALYVKSFNREPLHRPTLERLVELCYRRRQWENAARIGEALMSHYPDQRSDAEIADLHVHVGLCELHVAQRDVALKRLRELLQRGGQGAFVTPDALRDAAESWAATVLEPGLLAAMDLTALTRVIRQMERALRRVPEHLGALQVLAGLTMARGDWDRSLRYLERAVEAPRASPEDRARLLLCAAEVAVKKLLSVQRARMYCDAAASILPGSELVRRRAAELLDPASGQPAETVRTTIDFNEADTQVLLLGGAPSANESRAREEPAPRRSRR